MQSIDLEALVTGIILKMYIKKKFYKNNTVKSYF